MLHLPHSMASCLPLLPAPVPLAHCARLIKPIKRERTLDYLSRLATCLAPPLRLCCMLPAGKKDSGEMPNATWMIVATCKETTNLPQLKKCHEMRKQKVRKRGRRGGRIDAFDLRFKIRRGRRLIGSYSYIKRQVANNALEALGNYKATAVGNYSEQLRHVAEATSQLWSPFSNM